MDWPAIVSPLLEFLGKLLPCKSLLSFKARAFRYVVLAVLGGVGFRVVTRWPNVSFEYGSGDLGAAIAVLAVLVFLVLVDAILAYRRQSVVRDSLQLLSIPDLDPTIRDAILDEFSKL